MSPGRFTASHSEQSGQSPANRSPRFSHSRINTSSLSKDNIENLIKTGSPAVKLVNPKQQKSHWWAGFNRVEYDGKLEHFAYCCKCQTVLQINRSRATHSLRKHTRICCKMSESIDTPTTARSKDETDMRAAESSSELQQPPSPIRNDAESSSAGQQPPSPIRNDAESSSAEQQPPSPMSNDAESSSAVQQPPSPIRNDPNTTPTRCDHNTTINMPRLAPLTSPIDHTDKSPCAINDTPSPDIFSSYGNSPSDSPNRSNNSFDQMQPLESPNYADDHTSSDSTNNDSYCERSSSEQVVPTQSPNSKECPCSDNNTSINSSLTSETSPSAKLLSSNDKENLSEENDKSRVCDHPKHVTSDPHPKSSDTKDADEMRKQVLDAAVAMCVKDLKPLSTCQGAGFKHFVHQMLKIVYPNSTLDTSAFVPDTTTAIRHLSLTYSKLKDKVKEDLCGAGPVAMRAEVRDNHVTLSACYISATWTITSRVLSTRHVEDETQLTAALNDTLQEFGLESSVCVWATKSSTVQSRCPNTVRALTTIKQLPCAVQSLDRAVSQVLYSDQSDMVDPAKALYPATTSQRDDVINVINAWEGLAHHCQASGLKLALVEEYPRDWKSRLARLEAISENWKPMRVFLQDRHETFLRRENVDKHVLDDVIRLLQAFRRVTDLLNKADTPTLHLVLPVKVWLLQQCKQGLFDCAVIAKLKEGLRRGVETNLIIDPLHEVASSLHPQKKFLSYITKSHDRLDISNRVKEALRQLLACDLKNDTVPPTKRRKVDSQSILDAFWSDSDLNIEDDHIDLDVEESHDVMKYWSSNYKKWPALAAVARRVLAIPASAQPPSDWVSDLDKRALLEPEALDQIVFLNYNMDL